jgi:hypothetical protein
VRGGGKLGSVPGIGKLLFLLDLRCFGTHEPAAPAPLSALGSTVNTAPPFRVQSPECV